MNWLNTVLVLVAAFLAVFWEAAFGGIRHFTGAQIDLLPPLMVYASLFSGISSVSFLAFFVWFLYYSLFANPFGISVLPFFFIGLFIYANRELILRDQTFAQVVLGFGASAVAPAITLLLLLTTGRGPLFGWGTLWQLIVMSVGGAVATPVCFELFGWLRRTLIQRHPGESSFRPDREIRRGRS